MNITYYMYEKTKSEINKILMFMDESKTIQSFSIIKQYNLLIRNLNGWVRTGYVNFLKEDE